MDHARDHLAPWIPFAHTVTDLDKARDLLQRLANDHASDTRHMYGIWLDDRLVGGALFPVFDTRNGMCELGVWLVPGGRRAAGSSPGRALSRRLGDPGSGDEPGGLAHRPTQRAQQGRRSTALARLRGRTAIVARGRRGTSGRGGLVGSRRRVAVALRRGGSRRSRRSRSRRVKGPGIVSDTALWRDFVGGMRAMAPWLVGTVPFGLVIGVSAAQADTAHSRGVAHRPVDLCWHRPGRDDPDARRRCGTVRGDPDGPGHQPALGPSTRPHGDVLAGHAAVVATARRLSAGRPVVCRRDRPVRPGYDRTGGGDTPTTWVERSCSG